MNRAPRPVAESADQRTEADRFDELLDLIGERLSENDVRSAAWR